MAFAEDLPGPLELLVLQPTPFCNIDCSYCYLPDRLNGSRVTAATVRSVAQWVVQSGQLGSEVGVLWHAGEPLTVPVDYYRELTSIIVDAFQGCESRFRVQTNAVGL